MEVRRLYSISSFFFFNDTATTEIYTLSLHDALPIALRGREPRGRGRAGGGRVRRAFRAQRVYAALREYQRARGQSRSPGDEHALRSRDGVRADRLRLQLAATAGGEIQGSLPVRA